MRILESYLCDRSEIIQIYFRHPPRLSHRVSVIEHNVQRHSKLKCSEWCYRHSGLCNERTGNLRCFERSDQCLRNRGKQYVTVKGCHKVSGGHPRQKVELQCPFQVSRSYSALAYARSSRRLLLASIVKIGDVRFMTEHNCDYCNAIFNKQAKIVYLSPSPLET